MAPSLVEVGFKPLAAHMFIFYLGMMSMVTPPVAAAAFAAATLADADLMQTGYTAMRFGWTAYIVPFLFVMSPQLLMVGNPLMVALIAITAIAGVWLISIGAVGYFAGPLNWLYRVLFAIAGIGVLVPANAFPLGIWTDIAGAAFAAVLIALRLGIGTRKTVAT